MRIVVVGGTGMVGSKLIKLLLERGHDAVAASPSTGVDAITGIGVPEAVSGAHVLVDVSDPRSRGDTAPESFHLTASMNLVEAARHAGVRHFVIMSAVGADRLSAGEFFMAKLQQESVVRTSRLPFTIVRSPPFYEFLYRIIDNAACGNDMRLPALTMQPLATEDAARSLLSIVEAEPVRGIVEIGGPEPLALTSIAEMILVANEDTRTITVDPDATYLGVSPGDEELTVNDGRVVGAMRFEDWLRRTLVG